MGTTLSDKLGRALSSGAVRAASDGRLSPVVTTPIATPFGSGVLVSFGVRIGRRGTGKLVAGTRRQWSAPASSRVL